MAKKLKKTIAIAEDSPTQAEELKYLLKKTGIMWFMEPTAGK
jgi:hypothetical protein